MLLTTYIELNNLNEIQNIKSNSKPHFTSILSEFLPKLLARITSFHELLSIRNSNNEFNGNESWFY